MKKTALLLSIILTATFAGAANETIKGNELPTVKTTDHEEANKRISSVRQELAQLGYSLEMMNDLFGDENFYFPTTEEKFETTIYIVDLLIENGQYKQSAKSDLIAMAVQAHSLYTNTQSTAAVSGQ